MIDEFGSGFDGFDPPFEEAPEPDLSIFETLSEEELTANLESSIETYPEEEYIIEGPEGAEIFDDPMLDENGMESAPEIDLSVFESLSEEEFTASLESSTETYPEDVENALDFIENNPVEEEEYIIEGPEGAEIFDGPMLDENGMESAPEIDLSVFESLSEEELTAGLESSTETYPEDVENALDFIENNPVEEEEYIIEGPEGAEIFDGPMLDENGMESAPEIDLSVFENLSEDEFTAGMESFNPDDYSPEAVENALDFMAQNPIEDMDAPKTLTRDQTEQWIIGNNAIDNTVEAMRDNLRDLGMEDGPDMEAIVMGERARMQEELSRNIEGDFSQNYEMPNFQELYGDTIVESDIPEGGAEIIPDPDEEYIIEGPEGAEIFDGPMLDENGMESAPEIDLSVFESLSEEELTAGLESNTETYPEDVENALDFIENNPVEEEEYIIEGPEGAEIFDGPMLDENGMESAPEIDLSVFESLSEDELTAGLESNTETYPEDVENALDFIRNNPVEEEEYIIEGPEGAEIFDGPMLDENGMESAPEADLSVFENLSEEEFTAGLESSTETYPEDVENALDFIRNNPVEDSDEVLFPGETYVESDIPEGGVEIIPDSVLEPAQAETTETPTEKPFDYDSIKEQLDKEFIEDAFKGIDCFNETEKLDTLMEPFEQANWEKLDQQEKLDSMEKLKDYLCDKLELKNPPKFESYTAAPSEFGGYSDSRNELLVNVNALESNTEAVDTIAHELWHARQHQLANEATEPRHFQYQYQFDNYIRPEDDFVAYESQLIEQEARAFGAKFQEYLRNKKGA